MTEAQENFNREVDARIARALRMLAFAAKPDGWEGKRMKEVADDLDPPEPELKPCPWCHKEAEVNNYNDEVVRCKTHTVWMDRDDWNRREVPHAT